MPKFNIYYLLIPCMYAYSKLVFNTEGSALGGFNPNFLLFANALGTLAFLLLIIMIRNRFKSIPKNPLFVILIIYYTFGLFSASYSPLPIITLYNSIAGIFFVFAASSISEILNEYEHINDRYNEFHKLILYFINISIFVNVIFVFLYEGKFDFFSHGVGADYTAALLLFYSLSKLHLDMTQRNIIIFFLSLLLALKLNSFSSMLSIAMALTLYLFLIRKYLLFFIVIVIVVVSGLAFINYLDLYQGSDIAINNKDVNAYITGSGRFDYYQVALSVISEFDIFQVVFGNGFMAERVIMDGKDLPWITDPHNSLLMSTLGMGAIGVILYFVFVLYPFVRLKIIRPVISGYDFKINIHWMFFHIMCITYGITSSYYIGRPKELMIFALVFSEIVRIKNENKVSHDE